MREDWYKDAVVYGIDVARFYDSDDNGVGDLNGVIEKLDYIQSLGVNCLWLLPFFPSARRDNGYDVIDYMDVDHEMGTLDDFNHLIDEAHDRGMKVIIELIVQHSSNEHPWFKKAASDKNSKYHDYYIWSDKPKDDPDDQPVFTDTEKSVWRYVDAVDAYYHHKFYHFEPDLNVANPEVWDAIEEIIDFWVQRGIDGFRLDAATHMFSYKGMSGTQLDAGKYMGELRQFVEKRRRGVVLLGEADVGIDQLQDYFDGNDRMHMLYNFMLNNYLFLALARQETTPIADCLHRLSDVTQTGTWLNFLRNLDEVDLEQLSDDERQEVFHAFAPKPEMQIYGTGMRRSLPSMLGRPRQLRMAYSLLFAMPGVPMMTYGSEIGLGDNLSLPGRSSVRLPMQWNSSRFAGFSRSDENRGVLDSVLRDGPYGHQNVNVAKAEEDPGSLLHFMRDLIEVRKNYPNIGRQKVLVMESENSAILVLRYGTILAIHNLSDRDQAFELSIPEGSKLVYGEDYPSERALQPFGYSWIEIEEAVR